MRTNPDDRLGNVLFGKAKRAILSRLFGSPDRRFFVRELARASGLTASTLSRDLAALADAGVISRMKEGRQVYYQANSASPVFDELRSLVTKTFGIADVVREMLTPVMSRIEFAAIFGSVAAGTHSFRSDVDLLIVGDLNASEIAERLLSAEKALGRKISPTVFSPDEFRKNERISPFVRALMAKPMIVLAGEINGRRRRQR